MSSLEENAKDLKELVEEGEEEIKLHKNQVDNLQSELKIMKENEQILLERIEQGHKDNAALQSDYEANLEKQAAIQKEKLELEKEMRKHEQAFNKRKSEVKPLDI